jgi:hypothetical protein
MMEKLLQLDRETALKAYEAYLALVAEVVEDREPPPAYLREVLDRVKKTVAELVSDVAKERKRRELKSQLAGRKATESEVEKATAELVKLRTEYEKLCKPIINGIELANAKLNSLYAKLDFFNHVEIEYANSYWHELDNAELAEIRKKAAVIVAAFQAGEIEAAAASRRADPDADAIKLRNELWKKEIEALNKRQSEILNKRQQ